MSKPAARITDMHVCPMVTPGTPPIPHVGGPVLGPGVPTVLIGGMPAAVLGDSCTCTGPPDTIILGSTGVLIGGKPAARMGDMTAHGGTIAAGCPTVLIGEVSPSPTVVKSSIFTVLKKAITSTQKKTEAPSKQNEEMAKKAMKIAGQNLAMKQAADAGKPFVERC
jgi:uncharacterized Zn-binding protein involved in type VI secretion